MGNDQGRPTDEEIKMGKERITDLEKSLQKTQKELFVKNHEVLSIRNQLDQANVTTDELTFEKKKFENYKQNSVLYAKQEQDIFVKEITELRTKNNEMQRRIEYLNDTNNARLNLNEYNLKKQDILKEIDALNKQKESVTVVYNNLCTKIAEKDNIMREINALNKQKESVTIDYNNLRTKIAEKDNIMKEIDAFNKQKVSDRIDYNNLYLKITDLKKIKDILSGEIDELQKMKKVSSKQLEEFRVKNSAASKVIDKLNDKKVDMLRQINRLDTVQSSADLIINVWSPKNLTYSITSLMPSHLITDCDSIEFNIVKKQFMKSTQKHFQVHKVQKINNPHLRAMKMLREKEHEILHGKAGVRQMLLYRAFKINLRKLAECSFLDIIQRYGFIKFSKFSSHECHKCQIIGEWKCMVVSSVIVCDMCQSEPPTSTGISVDYGKIKPLSVNVYREDMFYPEYLLYFSGETIA